MKINIDKIIKDRFGEGKWMLRLRNKEFTILERCDNRNTNLGLAYKLNTNEPCFTYCQEKYLI